MPERENFITVEGIWFFYDEKHDSYSGVFNFENKNIEAILEKDFETDDHKSTIEYFCSIKGDFKSFIDKVLEKLSNKLITYASEWTDEEVSTEIIATRLRKNDFSIVISSDEFEIYFDDDFLFYGAKIHYREYFEEDKFDVDILT